MFQIINRIKKTCLVSVLVLCGTLAEVTPVFAETVSAGSYDEFAEMIKETTNFKATAIVKATESVDFSEYSPVRVIEGPDGYYFLEFDTDGAVDSYCKSMKEKSGVEYASKNYNIINKATAKQGGKTVKKTLRASVQNIIELEKDAEKDVDEKKVSEWESSDGKDVEYKPFSEFYEKTKGRTFWGGQCATGAQYYMQWLGYPVITCCSACNNGAKCFWIHRKTSGILENFIEIEPGEELQDGDILVYGPHGDNVYGHVSIYHEGASYGQNQSGGNSDEGAPFSELTPYTICGNYLGALRPKVYKNGASSYDVNVNLTKDSSNK